MSLFFSGLKSNAPELLAGRSISDHVESPNVTNNLYGITANDPRVTLTVRASSKKAVHITDFLTEKAKKRIKNRRKDLVLARMDELEDRLVVRAEDQHPYAGITISEWGAANIRVMNKLLNTGDLERSNIEYYLSYSASIFDFAEKYEWHSILDFDFQYREQQAEFQFMWGFINPRMELQLLIPRVNSINTRVQGNGARPLGNRFQGNNRQMSRNPRNIDCIQWKANNGLCSFGNDCKYNHPQLSIRPSQTSPNYQGYTSNRGSKNESATRPFPERPNY